MKKLIIAIDGPAGAGKSTVAQLVSRRLNYTYIDTGAMYRVIAWQVLANGITLDNEVAVAEVARTSVIELYYVDGIQRVNANGINITAEIRTPEISRAVAAVASQPAVREAMLTLQRQMATQGGVVMDGRDIGTHVLPWADLKIFLTASIDERARRRWLELTSKGYKIDLAELKQEIAYRDKTDCEREIAPLSQAKGAILIDTTALSIEGATTEILRLCEERARSV